MALGTDSSASNNSQDILEEMRFASLLQKGTRGDPALLSPAQSLAMATSAAGPATGFSLGHLAIQEPADLILVSRREPHWQPGLNSQADLLYAASASDVVLTMVNGVILYENGVPQHHRHGAALPDPTPFSSIRYVTLLVIVSFFEMPAAWKSPSRRVFFCSFRFYSVSCPPAQKSCICFVFC